MLSSISSAGLLSAPLTARLAPEILRSDRHEWGEMSTVKARAKAGKQAAKTPAPEKKAPNKAPVKAKAAAARPKRRDGRIRAGLLKTVAKRLTEQRHEILSLYRLDQGVGQSVSHEGEDDVDRANFNSSRELALSLSTGEREALRLIGEAMDRLGQDSYGSCSNCNETIAEERLLVIPWARHCVDCQELEERGLLNP